MPKNPFAKSGRSSQGYHDDHHASAPGSQSSQHSVKGESPLTALRHFGDKLRPHTAVTSTEEEPGRSSTDRPAGTSVPIAQRAKPSAYNAGAHAAGVEGSAIPEGHSARAEGDFQHSVDPSHASIRSNTTQQSRFDSTQSNQQHRQTVDNPSGEPSLQQRAEQQSGNAEKAALAQASTGHHAPDRSGATTANAAAQVNGGQHQGAISNDNASNRDQHSEFDFQANNSTAAPVSGHQQPSSSGEAPPDTTFKPSQYEHDRLEKIREVQAHGGVPTDGIIPGVTEPLAKSQESENVTASQPAHSANTGFRSFLAHPLHELRPRKSTASSLAQSDRNGRSSATPMTSRTSSDFREAGASSSIKGHAGQLTDIKSKHSRAGSAYSAADVYSGSGKKTGGESIVGRPSIDGAASQATYDLPKRQITTHFATVDAQKNVANDSKQNDVAQDAKLAPDSVPGLEIGNGDPGLPGRKKESADYDQAKIDKKYGTIEEQLADTRVHQSDYVGWRQVGGWDTRTALSQDEAADLLQRSTLLEQYINDKYIGDWYQNTALIIGTAFFAWIIGRFGGSISWLSIVLLFSATVYRTSIRRLRRNYRDDVLRETSLRKIETDNESMEWLNSFLVKFWVIYEPSLSAMITQIGNEVLKESTPGFIESLTLEKFTLGTKAPRIEFVRSFPKTDPSVAVMDWSASFTPNDVMDLTARQLKTKVNPKIQLGVRIGKGFVSKSLPILVEDMSFSGTFRLRFKMMSRFPHIETVDFSFLEPPQFDFVLKPIGGDTFGFDINIIPGLSKFIKEIVHANLGPMFYAPNAFQVNLEQMMAGVGVMSGIGVLSLSLKNAAKLHKDLIDGSVDPYVRVLSQDKKELARTKIKANDSEPVWDETLHVIVTSLSEALLLEVLDFNEVQNDRSLGMIALQIENILEKQGDNAATVNITSGGRNTGELTYSAHYSAVQMPKPGEAGEESVRDTKSGILALKVTGARNLDSRLSKVGQLSTFCEIELDGKLLYTTKVAKDNNSPEWGFSTETIITNRSATQLVARIRDNRGKRSPQVGIAKLKLSEIILESQKGNDWFSLEPEDAGEIQISAQWKPVALADIPGSSYVEPVGMVRLNIISATDLRNLEHVGKVDPYVRVFLNNQLVGKTNWFQNTLSPVFNEFVYIPVQNELQVLTLEVMDVERRGKDRSLGFFKLDLQTVMQKDEKGNYKVLVSQNQLTSRLAMPERGPKGTLTYSVEFYPNIPVLNPDEIERVTAVEEEVKALRAKKDRTEKDDDDIEIKEERLKLAGIHMPLEKQLEYGAGIVAFSFGTATGLARGLRLRITRENKPQPIYISPPARSSTFVVGQSADYITGQASLSSIRIQIVNQDNVENPKSVEAEVTISAHEALREAYLKPKTYNIGPKATISLTCRYFPLPDFAIDASEDISRTGSIEVKLHRAVGVEAADTSGTSDPYTAFYLNDSKDKIYKSKIVKKTLDPVWDEDFRFDVKDIKSTLIKAMVFDWDMGNSDDFLGGAEIDASELVPLEWKDYTLHLSNIKKGSKQPRHQKDRQGTIELSLRHTPGILQVDDDEDVLGLKSVTKTAQNGVMGAVGVAAGVGQHGQNAGHRVLGVFGRRSMDSQREDEDLVEYSVSVEKVTGLDGVKEVQLRAFTMSGREKEVYKSKNIKVDGSVANFDDGIFDFKAGRDEQIGFKLREMKGLGRHHDLGQSTTTLSPGEHEVDFGGLVAHINVMRNS